jgi:hypothetical protein
MALVERLMGEPFEADPGRRIAVHQFASSCFEVAFGPRTVAQIKNYYAMTPADSTEFDLLIAQVSGTDAVKHRTIFQFEQVFLLAEARAPFYDTPALVRSRLSLPTP